MSFARCKSAFSLVEVVVSMGILATLLLALAATSASAVQLGEDMRERRAALAQAASVLERILATDSLESDPAYVDPNSGEPTRLVHDLASDLGEAAPAGLDGWSGSAEVRAYRFDALVDGAPAAWRDLADPKPFLWGEGQLFEVRVTVRWRPSSVGRTGGSQTSAVTLRSFYYPSPEEP
ncbi:MAG: hypothetical protein D6731_23010 [Planctomycetota bacterium]|nr:MAG: hypothetical protein D6731_23010 [Planctomycetota bacterium]